MLGYATRVLRLLGRYATSRIEARFDRSLLRTYEKSTCSKSSIVFSDTKPGPMKKRTTPIYATCNSPIMRLLCPPPPPPQCAVECMWKGLPLFLAKCRAARFIISSRVKRACITQASQGQRDFLLAINVSFAGAVSTSSCMLRMETNGETDHLQHDLFVDISYKFTLA